MSNKILDDLIACGVPSDTLLEVAKLIAAAELAEKNRAQTRERVQRFRDRKRYVTSRNDTVTLPPPACIDSPPEIKPKKVLSAKCALPADFELSESDNRHATKAGWSADKVSIELQRFRDHAAASGRKQADWHAAWRNWVSSPYQSNGNGVHHESKKPSVSDVLRGMCDDLRERESPDFNGLLPPVGRR